MTPNLWATFLSIFAIQVSVNSCCKASPLPPSAAKYLMVIGGSSSSPNFVPLEPHHSLPLCLRNTFKPIGGQQQYYYRPPLMALPDGRPLLCEARINSGSCYVFDIIRDEWQQNGTALYPGEWRAFDYSPGLGLVIAGGYDGKTNMDKVERIADFGATFEAAEPLPKAVNGACLVIVDHRVFVIGGYDGSSYIGDAYFADTFMLDKICSWTKVPGGLRRGRGDHSCSAVVTPNGQSEIVVVGGTDDDDARLNSVEIFNVDTGVWREGNDFPLHIDWHAQVRHGDTFLITGGWGGAYPSNTRELDTVYSYNVDNDSFTLMPTRLPTAIHGHAALVLDRAPRYCDTNGKEPLSAEEAVKWTGSIFGTNGVLWRR